ncbi:MAG: hypothetical protein EOP34_08540 [Rickettsiales bacterium]|nr:MAG: hypothetical protein EOP34_08540 [Rickettsiales bacterium]
MLLILLLLIPLMGVFLISTTTYNDNYENQAQRSALRTNDRVSSLKQTKVIALTTSIINFLLIALVLLVFALVLLVFAFEGFQFLFNLLEIAHSFVLQLELNRPISLAIGANSEGMGSDTV